jgi:hypothetical protein
MKKLILFLAVTILFSAAVEAQTDGYVGLFADTLNSSWCISGTPTYVVTMYIMCLPSINGMYAVEFRLIYPEGGFLIPAAVTINPNYNVYTGDVTTGIQISLADCFTDWMWAAQQTLIVTGATQGEITVVEHPGSGGIHMVDCGYDRERYVAKAFTKLYINYQDGVDPECDQTPVSGSTWSKIKTMYTE